MTRLKRDVRITYAGESDFNVGPVGSAGEPRDVSTREEMDAVLALCAADPKLSWEGAKERYFRGLPSRYEKATAPRPGLPADAEFDRHFPVTQSHSGYTVRGDHISRTRNSSEETAGGPAHSLGYPAATSQTITKRLGIVLTPAEPWIRPAIEDPEDGSLWSVDQAEIDRAIAYAQRHGCPLDEAMGRLGVRAQRIGQHQDRQGHSPEDMHALLE